MTMNFLFLSMLLLDRFLLADPNFTPQVLDDNVSIGYGVAIGDVDGDAKPDILLADKKEFVWYRNGDWKRFVMVSDLTESDNVCIAARDIDGDGKVEVAVGAQWNPGETSDMEKSGSVHYLVRPADPTQLWKAVQLRHEPTVHRMQWVKIDQQRYHLVMLPLHGRGNKDGAGNPVKVIAYEPPQRAGGEWQTFVIDESMHLTHNLDVVSDGSNEKIFIGGKEGIRMLGYENGKWSVAGDNFVVSGHSFGEVRVSEGRDRLIAGIEPMHGNTLAVYEGQDYRTRTLLTDDLKQGHALAVADLLDIGSDQVVAGWREPDSEGKVGIRIFVRQAHGSKWTAYWIDENKMACEDLKVADLNGDGKRDIIAAGRASHNLVVYWNNN